MANGVITRSAIGREGFIGDLYDARTDTFARTCVLKKAPSSDVLRSLGTNSCVIEYVYTDDYSDKFDKLQVDAELKLSILAGLFSVSGSGHYLTDVKKSERSVRCSLIYKITTVVEDLNFSSQNLLPCLEYKALDLNNATHIVQSINWGANATVVLESNTSKEQSIQEVSGSLQSTIHAIAAAIDVKGKGESVSNSARDLKNYRLTVYADVIPDGPLPQTIQSGMEFMAKIPKLIETCNSGKGKPLSFTLIPINTVRKILNLASIKADVVLKTLDEDIIASYVRLFEDTSKKRQKLNDYLADFNNHISCVPDDTIFGLRNVEKRLNTFEAETRKNLAKNLLNLRNGTYTTDNLSQGLEERNVLTEIDLHFDSLMPVVEKINRYDLIVGKGGVYIGRNTSLETVLHTTTDAYLLVIKESFKKSNYEMFCNNVRLFLKLMNEEKDSKFIVLDLDMIPSSLDAAQTCIWRYKNGKYISKDFSADLKAELSLNLVKSVTRKEYITCKPNNRATVELLCPGFVEGTCSNEPLTWQCQTCKDTIEYGFDNFFYCNCGRSNIHNYLYRCSHEDHGDFITFPDPEALNINLAKLRPMKELNLLILGQSGVGKSTWINSIVNYLKFECFEDAEKHGGACIIPASFTVTDDNFQKQVIRIGETDANETLTVGQSATQGPRTYTFTVGETRIRLVDTPGIGDVRGLEKDKENVGQILNHISYLKELHGICILLKPNESRISVLFRFCVKELLTNLHKNASQNIVFCFTNARSTFYKPGDTLPVLTDLLSELDVGIALSKATVYCLDNESFRFLCTLKHPNITYDEMERNSYTTSWDKSVLETRRMFDHIRQLPPHKIEDTTTLCEARKIILNLTKPMAEITQNIQVNISAIEDEEQRILHSKKSEEELLGNLYIPHIVLVPTRLDRPRTVCTSSACVSYHKLEDTGYKQIEYRTHCHPECYLSNVTAEVLPNAQLLSCAAMNGNSCKVCGCSWETHMHITYSQTQESRKVINKTVENEIHFKKSSRAKIEEHILSLRRRISQYEEEQKIVTEVGAKFGMFLRENAITPYNDALRDYIKLLIQQEETKVLKTNVDDSTLNGLRNTLQMYEEEVMIIKESMKDVSGGSVSVHDIKPLVQRLYDLPLSGSQLRNCLKVAKESNARAMSYNEQYIPLHSNDKTWGEKLFGWAGYKSAPKHKNGPRMKY